MAESPNESDKLLFGQVSFEGVERETHPVSEPPLVGKLRRHESVSRNSNPRYDLLVLNALQSLITIIHIRAHLHVSIFIHKNLKRMLQVRYIPFIIFGVVLFGVLETELLEISHI